jgi:hypothetical protein
MGWSWHGVGVGGKVGGGEFVEINDAVFCAVAIANNRGEMKLGSRPQ